MSMTPRPFEHTRALVDCRKSILYMDDAAKITLKLLNEKGIINVGGDPMTVYEFAKKGNPDIGKLRIKEVNDVEIAEDSTMNIEKMIKILNEPR